MKKYFIVILILICCLTINVKAMTLKPTCPASVTVGSSFEVNVTLTRSGAEKEISGVDGTFSFDSNKVSLTGQKLELANWTSLSEVSNNNKFSFVNLTFNALIKETNKNISKLTFKANAEGSLVLNITNPTATDGDAKLVEISGGSCTINVKAKPSDINTLSSLKIDGSIVNNFNSNTTTYSKTVASNVTSVNIEATKTDSKSTISGDLGKKNLNYGLNTFKIIVTSESGIKKEYVLNLTREDNRSKVNTLKSLSLSEGKINFKSETNTYSVNLEETVEKVKITSELTDLKSKYVAGFGNREVTLKEGDNTVLVKVQAENGNVNTYTINIIRGKSSDERNKNTKIKELVIENHEINFSNDVYEYNVNIKDESELIINVVLEEATATYEIEGNESLKEGSVVIIKVTSSDKTIVKEYKLNIKEQSEIIEDSENNQDDITNDNNTKKDKTNLKELYIGIAIFGVGLVLFIVSLINRKNKKNNSF